MTDEIGVGSPARAVPNTGQRMQQMRIGDAVVWVQLEEAPATVETGDEVYAAASLPSPTELFTQGVRVLRECVRVVGDQLGDLGGATRPREVRVEFGLSFEASSEGGFIPVFRAGAGVTTGLKVTAVWQYPAPTPPKAG